MAFNEANKRYEQNLEGAYNELLEAKELEILEQEILEDEIMGDVELFDKLALSYARASINTPQELSFLDWAVRRLRRQREPEHTRAWRTT